MRQAGRAPSLEVGVRPPWPYRLPRSSGGDGVLRSPRPGIACRLLHVHGEPVVVHAWQAAKDRFVFRAAGPDRGRLELAIERMRFASGVDVDLSEFHRRFKRDPLIGPAISKRPWHRPRRRPWPWEALAWAVTSQFIEAFRAAEIQRRIVRRWGPKRQMQDGVLRDVPDAALIAGRAPAELAAMDLAASRALAMIKCAKDVAAGRVDLHSPEADRRLLRISGIGPWTVQCLGFGGRGDPDSLPAGDLAYVKLVGRLANLGRRATVPEVEEFFAPYEPFRGLAGSFALVGWHKAIAKGPPLRIAA
jgi:3-methyladenine DNA glycosylase/8-oxoguanine DNA glycosylase